MRKRRKNTVARWIEALRGQVACAALPDGEPYKQGYEKLREGECFCAMGVLFHQNGLLSASGKLLLKKRGNVLTAKPQVFAVLEKLGVPLWLANDVVDLNDVQRVSFSEIADHIETQMKEAR